MQFGIMDIHGWQMLDNIMLDYIMDLPQAQKEVQLGWIKNQQIMLII